MTFEEALKAIKEGKKVRNKGWSSSVYLKKYCDRVVNQDGKTMNLTITSMLSDDWEEYKEPILDEEEKKYLSAVIKPFKDRVFYIQKVKTTNLDNQFIFIRVKRYDCEENERESTEYEDIDLPYFKANTMYKNMKGDKKYSLKELGL